MGITSTNLQKFRQFPKIKLSDFCAMINGFLIFKKSYLKQENFEFFYLEPDNMYLFIDSYLIPGIRYGKRFKFDKIILDIYYWGIKIKL